jgi:type II secretory ATPase GspE/PulE/Tfp pilus assembly ATPase PilB-like protein
VAELRKASIRQGILSLRQSALDLVSKGETSVEEVYRTTME